MPHLATPSPAWAGVQHRHLASLSAIAKTRSFRGAARTLGYSQSALSQHIAHLETVLATTLIARRRGSADVELTAAGELLLTHVEEILGIYRAAEADLAVLAEGGSGRLRIGLGDAVSPTLLPALLPGFVAAHPGVTVDITHARGADELAAALAAGRLDVAIGDAPDPRWGLATRALAPEPYVLAAPAAWPVVRAPGASAAELLEHLPLVRAADDPATGQVERELRAHGLALRGTTRAGAPSSLTALVAAGVGAAVLPAGLCPADDPRLVLLPLDGLVTPRALTVAWHAERRAAELVHDFVERAGAARPPVSAAVAA